MATLTGSRAGAGSRMKTKPRKRIHHACLDNLHHFLEGEVNFEEWELRQEELESQLGPHPELPLMAVLPEPEEPEPKRTPKHPKAA